ncbi:hypothetical protein L228DRAFT_120717 [Xylona heveae TC161]|uniref:Uncharacterized protein n=1 Tax=Xylona heveae (strain CBS 132557 / TC161) TaxID=1328760 RepID=A0A165HJM4_XYLHT|nr:hypothetical protein L228DRAFT_120717 [Xylona heveae TC161]KZF23611.1 hypothetical protein L228DRAFT_120717 [Xylona heveae TC161]
MLKWVSPSLTSFPVAAYIETFNRPACYSLLVHALLCSVSGAILNQMTARYPPDASLSCALIISFLRICIKY